MSQPQHRQEQGHQAPEAVPARQLQPARRRCACCACCACRAHRRPQLLLELDARAVQLPRNLLAQVCQQHRCGIAAVRHRHQPQQPRKLVGRGGLRGRLGAAQAVYLCGQAARRERGRSWDEGGTWRRERRVRAGPRLVLACSSGSCSRKSATPSPPGALLTAPGATGSRPRRSGQPSAWARAAASPMSRAAWEAGSKAKMALNTLRPMVGSRPAEGSMVGGGAGQGC